MAKAKVKVLHDSVDLGLERKVNEFLQTIDVLQVLKIQYCQSESQYQHAYSCMIVYLENFEDIRDIKLDKILL